MNIRTANPHPSLRLEGALLSRDFVARLASPSEKELLLSPKSYGLAEGDKLNEAITRSWNALRGRWEKFRDEIENSRPVTVRLAARAICGCNH